MICLLFPLVAPFFKGAAALTVAGALGAHHAGEQSAQAATLDVMTTPLTFKITEASFDISGFNLSYEITGLQAVLDTGLYTPYIEVGYYTKKKGFTQFYFFSLEPKKRIENDPYVRHHVILARSLVARRRTTGFACLFVRAVSSTPSCVLLRFARRLTLSLRGHLSLWILIWMASTLPISTGHVR